jgi:translocation and assembly module TamB
MPQEVENLKTSEDSATEPGESKDVGPAKAENKPRRFGVGKLSLGLFLVAVIVGILTVVVFQTGAVESYVRGKFTSKMDRSGISFKSEKFSLRTFPLRLELRNAEFSNKVTKEPLLSIRSADIELSFIDLFAFRTTRDISVDSVDINGIDVYLNFDEEGRSNFTGVKITEDDELVKVTYQAAQVSVKNGRFRIGDEVRDIGFDLKEISLALNPKKSQSAVTGIENDISLRTGKSSFRLADGSIDDISLLLEGVIGPDSIEIAKLNIESATTSTSLKGTLSGFESPDYSFEVDSNLDIGSLSRILSPGTPINGSGKLRGRVTGKGADFKFKGAAETESLFTDGFSLRSLDVTASYEGRSGDYLLNGGAIAEALTFGGVQIDLPRLSGMLKGNGSDFEWLGELQAVAVRTGAGTIGGLFLRDASLQRNDRGVTAKSDRVEFGRFVSDNLTINEIGATGFSLNNTQGFTDISVAGATASNLRTGDISLGGIRSGKISIRDDKTGLIIQSPQLSARKGSVGDLNLSELESDSVTVVNKEGKTSVRANSLSARNATIGPFSLDGVRVEEVEALDQPSGLVVYSRGLQTARIESDALSLGVVDVAGVRLRVFKGTVEFTTDNPIKAASVSLKSSDGSSNGSLSRVSAERLVYVVDPSGSYRATADVSIGGGNIGRLNLGAATAELEVSKDEVSVRNLNGDILGGKLQGTANFSIDENRNSNLNVSFSDLQASEIFTLFGGIAPPVTSSISGYGEFTFQGNDFTTSSGSLTAQSLINANVGFERIPLSGEVSVTAVNGLFAFQKARIETRYSTATVAGTLNIADLSANLKLFLGKRQGISEGNADEINAIVRPLISKTEIGQWAESNRFQTFGDLDFRGNLSGRLSNPELDGSVSISGISLRGKPLGSLSTGFAINPDALALRNGSIKEADGGNLSFSAMIPRYGENNIDVSARLSNVDFGSLIVLIPYDFPTAVQSIAANTSGSLDVTGLPGAMTGAADITATEVLFGMATFNRVQTTARLSESTINFDRLTLGFGQNSLEAPGSYDILSTDFNFDVSGKAMPLGALYAFIPANSPINEIGGTVDIKGYFKGRADDSSTFDVDFEGALLDVSLNRALIGNATIIGKSNETDFDFVVAPASGSPFPAVRGKLVLDNPNLPFNARLDFNKSSLEPIFNLFPLPNEEGVKGIVSGTVEIEGDLSSASGGFPVSKLKGTASIAQVDIQLPQTSISSSRPFSLALSNGLLTVGDRSGVAFTGGGSDLLVSGVKALDEISENNLSLRGRLNLGIINAFLANSFLSGIANVDIRITGPNADEILNGSASLERAALSTFVSTERITLDQLTGRINFTSNRVDINSVRGNLGGGKVSISGIATLLDDFRIERLILNISGEKVRVPFPKNFQTVGNANFRIDTERNGIALRTLISGRIVPQKASYETDIDLADVTGGRRESPISQSNPASSLGDVILDLSIEGRNALEVRNNLADLTASLSLRVTGDVGSPQISGRISSNSGLIFFRRDRYEIQRAELLFPPQTNADPILNLQAVAEIRGYQVIVALNGVISDAESLNLSVRSNPSLPQADVISLITTGSLANTESGIPTVAQSGISTAAEVLTNEIINKPVTRATDRLFGLNRFELDPIISGSRLNPTARLTVGRQINRDLAVTYSTNLSDTQNQVVAFEYRVSNRISFVAQYEQRELSNVTRQSNNFSFEVRLRKRF